MRGFEAIYEEPTAEGAPVLLLLHGTGGDERDLLPLGRTLAPEAGLLAPRGNVIEGDGIPRFFHRIPTGEPGPYPFTFDDDEIAGRGADLAAAVHERLEVEGVAERQLIGVGFSNGANMAIALLFVQPALLRAVVAFAPMAVLSDPPRPRLAEVAVWLGTGRGDPIATPEGVESLAALLTERGAAVTVGFHEGGHHVPADAVAQATSWVHHLRAASADPGTPLP